VLCSSVRRLESGGGGVAAPPEVVMGFLVQRFLFLSVLFPYFTRVLFLGAVFCYCFKCCFS
jgi:hypothetical protein